MPDSRSHRGAHPEDARDFASAAVPALRTAVVELSFLLGRDYAVDAAVKLVGDHHQLTVRQRKAVTRAACTDVARARRTSTRLTPLQLAGRDLVVDGFNCLITVEALLSGAPLFRGRDGALRDLASVHGTYRSVTETEAAGRLLAELLARSQPASVHVLLDRPIGNSGRTRALFAATFEAVGLPAEVALSDRVDRDIAESGRVVASSDGWLLDRAPAWVDLPGALVDLHSGPTWLVDLQDGEC